jgi:conjugal transfer mating pair stabilization protein TraN
VMQALRFILRAMPAPLANLLSILCLVWIVFAPTVQAAECRKVNTVCAEGAATRNIGGVDVYRDCWRYEDAYECVAPNSVDYCQAIAATQGCAQTGSVCTQTAFDGTCLNFQNTYRCADSVAPAQGVVSLANSYTIVSDQTNTAQCTPFQTNPDCTLAAHTCVARSRDAKHQRDAGLQGLLGVEGRLHLRKRAAPK